MGGHKYRYVIYKIADDKSSIDVEATGEATETYDQFKAKLPENDCRYAVFDYEWKTDDGRTQSKIVFINWAPDTAPIKSKMVSAASKDTLKKTLIGIAKEVQATDAAEVDSDNILD